MKKDGEPSSLWTAYGKVCGRLRGVEHWWAQETKRAVWSERRKSLVRALGDIGWKVRRRQAMLCSGNSWWHHALFLKRKGKGLLQVRHPRTPEAQGTMWKRQGNGCQCQKMGRRSVNGRSPNSIYLFQSLGQVSYSFLHWAHTRLNYWLLIDPRKGSVPVTVFGYIPSVSPPNISE